MVLGRIPRERLRGEPESSHDDPVNQGEVSVPESGSPAGQAAPTGTPGEEEKEEEEKAPALPSTTVPSPGLFDDSALPPGSSSLIDGSLAAEDAVAGTWNDSDGGGGAADDAGFGAEEPVPVPGAPTDAPASAPANDSNEE
jgi:hypothetical protein